MKRILCTFFLAVSIAAPAELSHLVRIDEHVYRGNQPKPEEFPELAQMGIKTVLDLRGGIIHAPKERKLVEAAGMRYVSIRLSGIFPPKKEQMARILALLEDPTEGPVFVHCRRGDDRAGMVIACYRIDHDHWTNLQAYEEARRNGLSRFELLMRHYVRKFDPSKLPKVSPEGRVISTTIDNEPRGGPHP